MTTKERIVQFIDYKGISKRKFCADAGLSHTIFNTPTSITSDNLEKINSAFPEISMEWAVSGRGEMLYQELGGTKDLSTTKDEQATYDTAYGKLNKEHEELKSKYIGCLEENKRYRDTYEKINLNEPVVKTPVK